MGYILPSPSSPAERARTLMAQKDAIEGQIREQLDILRANGTNTQEPLVDRDGFPRADIDIWAVRHARVRVIELRNDLSAVMEEIGQALQQVYDPSQLKTDEPAAATSTTPPTELSPFAKVNAIAPGSPAADAGLLREDLVVKFGTLVKSSFSGASLQPLAELVAANENKVVRVVVKRVEEHMTLHFTPRQGWGGRGMLGCHLVPHPA
ncbi:hypothetical protein EVG20_g6142 [Dentipellis fragilis]|uniref:Probable 26S proteasome regulatory subunit p27 n=1 Tax=Dentipellis fragilis TaxID=205917 RepID=A0A4Y9YQ47_9AGAM|nr:hypothetical protein EVG20_g6142 [Dentipellis fragilis]